MTRKLVTIRKVDQISPIEGADVIELAHLGGWQCVVKKGEFKENDDGLFFEIDSFIPIVEPFLFLEKSCRKRMGDKIGLRLKTIKLRGELSQGLLLPLSYFPDIDFTDTDKDYADELSVEKYEPEIPAQLSGIIEGMFPTNLCPKTDQERIQNLSKYFYQYKNITFEESEKLDGSSMTVYRDGEKSGVCSRNWEIKCKDGNTLWEMEKKYDIIEKLKEYTPHAIQGELMGPGIQKNTLKLKKHDFFVYDIYNIDERRYLTSEERLGMCKELGLKSVPILKKSSYTLNEMSMQELLEYSKGNSTICTTAIREGLVFKSNELINGNTISFKAINNDFLLK